MKVSIITVCYQSAATLEDTILSVRSQDYSDKEHIIVDGGSTDGTTDIIRRYQGDIPHWISEPDKSIYDAMNKGLALATGDVIGILNSDDLYADAQVITDVVNMIQKKQSDTLYADLVYVDREDPSRIKRYWKSGEYKPGIFRKGWMPPHPTFFVKKEIYRQYGTFNTELKSAADYEIMLRFLHRYEISTCYLPRVITLMRIGGQSNFSMKNRIRANREDRQAWKLNHLQPSPLTFVRKPLSKILQFVGKKPAINPSPAIEPVSK